MKKYMLLAKNDFNEEIFYTDIKKEAKKKLDELFDKYIFVKAYCYSRQDEVYKDITLLNKPSIYKVHTWEKKYVDPVTDDFLYSNDRWFEFTNEAEALRFMINSVSDKRHCALYKNGRRDWRV